MACGETGSSELAFLRLPGEIEHDKFLLREDFPVTGELHAMPRLPFCKLEPAIFRKRSRTRKVYARELVEVDRKQVSAAT